MATNTNIHNTTLSLTATHKSIKPDIQLTTVISTPLTLPVLLESIKSLREQSNKELSKWVDEDKARDKQVAKKKRKASEEEISDGDDTEQDLDADIDKIISEQTDTGANSNSKKCKC